MKLTRVLPLAILLSAIPVKAEIAGSKFASFNGVAFTELVSNAQTNPLGIIQGRVSYPSEFVPRMKICAQSVRNYQLINCVNTEARDRTSFQNFRITVSSGEYFVFAYASKQDTGTSFDYQAYYANSNRPISIKVSSGKATKSIQVNQWQLCRRNPRPSYCIDPSKSSSQNQPNQLQKLRKVTFTNSNWKVIPGAEVGRHPAQTSMDMNNLLRQGNVVTFEIIGYKGFYSQMRGNCSTGQVEVTRQGLQIRGGANYRETTPDEVSVTAWHRRLLQFACQNS